MKAPIVTPTGCPVCRRMGIPGTSCATCIRRAHGDALQLVNTDAREAERDRFLRAKGKMLARVRIDLVAAHAGAEVLLGAFGFLLVRVGFEVPSLARSHGPEAAP